MKGLSPIISGVLLILVALVATLLVGNTINQMAKDSGLTITNQSQDTLSCSDQNVFIESAQFDANFDCTRGVNHTINLTLRNAGTQKIYVNSIIAETTSGKIISFSLGQEINPGVTQKAVAVTDNECVSLISQNLTGYVSELKDFRIITDTCRLTDSISSRYITISNANQTEGRPSKYLIGLWHFNNNLSDSSGFGNDGTFGGGSAAYSPGVNSSMGESVLFDGANNYVEVPNSASLNSTSQITIEAWIYDPPKESSNDSIG